MTDQEYKDYYSRVVCFMLPFPCKVREVIQYLSVLPQDATILSTQVNDFGRVTEILVRHTSFPVSEEGVSAPTAYFIIKSYFEELGTEPGFGKVHFEPIGWEIGIGGNKIVFEEAVQLNEEV